MIASKSTINRVMRQTLKSNANLSTFWVVETSNPDASPGTLDIQEIETRGPRIASDIGIGVSLYILVLQSGEVGEKWHFGVLTGLYCILCSASAILNRISGYPPVRTRKPDISGFWDPKPGPRHPFQGPKIYRFRLTDFDAFRSNNSVYTDHISDDLTTCNPIAWRS